MKHTFIVLICLFLCGCESIEEQKEFDKNTKATIEWVNYAKKPITVSLLNHNEFDSINSYTLIDADAKIYNTNSVRLSLPGLIEKGE